MADARGSLGFLAFLRGDLQQARTYLADDLEVVTRIKAQGEQGFATIVLAHIACVEGNYSLAQQLAEEALALVRPHPLRERFIARVLAMVACGLGDYDQARQQIHTVFVQETRPGIRLLTLPMVALFQAHEGNLERAAELLGLSFTHPASAKGWLEHWPLITRLRQQLETQLGAEALAAAWENGSRLDLDTIVKQALVETDAQARQPRVEALTDRELEVLCLVAEGLSNRDIADTLTIVEGTVRTHIYNLCQKLRARNRTQAVARARALGIL
jgi:ATP/maltotriose-dependent transcriptional regulator MalT